MSFPSRSFSESLSVKGPDLRVVRVCPGHYKERKKHSRKVRNERAHTYTEYREREEARERQSEMASREKGRVRSLDASGG